MTILKWVLALAIGGFLIMMGVMKFTGDAHIFPYIEYKAAAAGLPFASLAYPLGNYLTGALELVAGVTVILPMTRKIGSLLAVLPVLGAVIFHLSPALGIVTPSGYADPKPVEALAAGGPFTAADFSGDTNMLFMMAAGGLLLAIINLIVQRNS
ncbi:hypothetical protein MNBD_ALPHA05-1161 [hydrothermal vent metagenome]|uniref:DoxX family protein n=1 Tax=hydrothermal vent metagenome TaxID=652676 RepID=A0A3B0SW48_9ZZZZ